MADLIKMEGNNHYRAEIDQNGNVEYYNANNKKIGADEFTKHCPTIFKNANKEAIKRKGAKPDGGGGDSASKSNDDFKELNAKDNTNNKYTACKQGNHVAFYDKKGNFVSAETVKKESSKFYEDALNEAKNSTDSKKKISKSDGTNKKSKVGFKEGARAFFKGMSKSVTKMFTDENGKFSLKQTAKTIGTCVAVMGVAAAVVAAEVLTAGQVTWILVGAGVAMGGIKVTQGAIKAYNATTEGEKLAALEDCGEGTGDVGMSVLFKKGIGKGLGKVETASNAAKASALEKGTSAIVARGKGFISGMKSLLPTKDGITGAAESVKERVKNPVESVKSGTEAVENKYEVIKDDAKINESTNQNNATKTSDAKRQTNTTSDIKTKTVLPEGGVKADEVKLYEYDDGKRAGWSTSEMEYDARTWSIRSPRGTVHVETYYIKQSMLSMITIVGKYSGRNPRLFNIKIKGKVSQADAESLVAYLKEKYPNLADEDIFTTGRGKINDNARSQFQKDVADFFNKKSGEEPAPSNAAVSRDVAIKGTHKETLVSEQASKAQIPERQQLVKINQGQVSEKQIVRVNQGQEVAKTSETSLSKASNEVTIFDRFNDVEVGYNNEYGYACVKDANGKITFISDDGQIKVYDTVTKEFISDNLKSIYDTRNGTTTVYENDVPRIRYQDGIITVFDNTGKNGKVFSRSTNHTTSKNLLDSPGQTAIERQQSIQSTRKLLSAELPNDKLASTVPTTTQTSDPWHHSGLLIAGVLQEEINDIVSDTTDIGNLNTEDVVNDVVVMNDETTDTDETGAVEENGSESSSSDGTVTPTDETPVNSVTPGTSPTNGTVVDGTSTGTGVGENSGTGIGTSVTAPGETPTPADGTVADAPADGITADSETPETLPINEITPPEGLTPPRIVVAPTTIVPPDNISLHEVTGNDAGQDMRTLNGIDENGKKRDIRPDERVELTQQISKADSMDDIANIYTEMRSFKKFNGRKNMRNALKQKRKLFKAQEDMQAAKAENCAKVEKKEKVVEKREAKFDSRMDKVDKDNQKAIDKYIKEHSDNSIMPPVEKPQEQAYTPFDDPEKRDIFGGMA